MADGGRRKGKRKSLSFCVSHGCNTQLTELQINHPTLTLRVVLFLQGGPYIVGEGLKTHFLCSSNYTLKSENLFTEK